MEDDKTTPNPTGGVMDIQPPKNGSSTTVAEKPDETSSDPVIITPTTPASEVSESEETKPADVTTTDSTEVTDAPSTEPTETNPNETPSTETQPSVDNPLAIDADAHPHKSGAPVVAIALAIIIALVLAAITVFVYLKTKEDTKTAEVTTSTIQPAISPQDVDQASADLDNTMNQIDDVKDFAADGLTDTALGL